jgi:hypothetical protein
MIKEVYNKSTKPTEIILTIEDGSYYFRSYNKVDDQYTYYHFAVFGEQTRLVKVRCDDKHCRWANIVYDHDYYGSVPYTVTRFFANEDTETSIAKDSFMQVLIAAQEIIRDSVDLLNNEPTPEVSDTTQAD